MNVSLSPELEKYVRQKVKSGLYTSTSEVIRESLRLMHTYEEIQGHRIQELNQAIEVGMTQLAQGDKVTSEKTYRRLQNKIQKIVKRKQSESQ